MALPPDLASAHFLQSGFLHAADHPFTAQQECGAYDINETFNSGFGFSLQAQFPSGHSAITQPHPPHLFSLSPALLNDNQHNAEPVRNFQSAFAAPASPMGPPAQPRKRKAPTLHIDAWEPYKDRILELHVTQRLPLPEVRQKIKKDYGFEAKYVAPFDKWKLK